MNFDKIYTDYFDQIKRTAKSFLKSEEDALDATQDTFLAVYESFDSYDESVSLSTWITQICINKCRDKLRKKKRENRVFVPLNKGNEYLLDSREDEVTPDMILSAEEDQASLNGLFFGLSDNIRQAMTLRLVDGLTYKQVAEKMQVPTGTVKTWVRRGRTHLSQVFSP